MTERFSSLRCREVINVSDGCRLGFVSDLELDSACGQVTALVVPCPGKWFGLLPSGEDYVIPWANIRRIGADLILVEVPRENCRRGRGKKGLFR